MAIVLMFSTQISFKRKLPVLAPYKLRPDDHGQRSVLHPDSGSHEPVSASALPEGTVVLPQRDLLVIRGIYRSEERRVGKECRSQRSATHERENGHEVMAEAVRR